LIEVKQILPSPKIGSDEAAEAAACGPAAGIC